MQAFEHQAGDGSSDSVSFVRFSLICRVVRERRFRWFLFENRIYEQKNTRKLDTKERLFNLGLDTCIVISCITICCIRNGSFKFILVSWKVHVSEIFQHCYDRCINIVVIQVFKAWTWNSCRGFKWIIVSFCLLRAVFFVLLSHCSARPLSSDTCEFRSGHRIPNIGMG